MMGVLRKTILLTQAFSPSVYEQYSGHFVSPQSPSGSYVLIQFLYFHFSTLNAFSKAFPSLTSRPFPNFLPPLDSRSKPPPPPSEEEEEESAGGPTTKEESLRWFAS